MRNTFLASVSGCGSRHILSDSSEYDNCSLTEEMGYLDTYNLVGSEFLSRCIDYSTGYANNRCYKRGTGARLI